MIKKFPICIKVISVALVIAFLSQDILWANPDALQIQTLSKSIATGQPDPVNLIKARLVQICTLEDSSNITHMISELKARGLVLPSTENGIRLIFDFARANFDKHDMEWSVPCLAQPAGRDQLKFTAYIGSDGVEDVVRSGQTRAQDSRSPLRVTYQEAKKQEPPQENSPKPPSILEAAEINIKKAAEAMELDDIFVDRQADENTGIISRIFHRLFPNNILLKPKNVTTVKFTVKVTGLDGVLADKIFYGFRALQNDARGPGKGGIRWIDVIAETPEEARAMAIGLATLMSIKNAVVGVPYGGGKGDILVGSKFYNDRPDDKARIVRGFARALTEEAAIGTFIDVPAPDQKTNARMMAWFIDEHLRVLAERGAIHDKSILNRLNSVKPEDAMPQRVPHLAEYARLLHNDREGVLQGLELGVITGKPVWSDDLGFRYDEIKDKIVWRGAERYDRSKTIRVGGSKGREKATGYGGFLAFKAVFKYLPSIISMADSSIGQELSPAVKELLNKDLSEMTVGVQGTGNVGEFNVWEFFRARSKIKLLQDANGTVFNPEGIDIDMMNRPENLPRTDGLWDLGNIRQSFLEGTGTVKREASTFWTEYTDIKVVAATQNVITEEVARIINCRIVLELANNPTTPAAAEILRRRGILVIPDVLANVGGVTVSYFEWLQNIEGRYWNETSVDKMLEERIYRETQEVVGVAKRYNTDLRTASFILALARIADAEIARNWKLRTILWLRKLFTGQDPYRYYGELGYDPDTVEELYRMKMEGKFGDLVARNEARHSEEISQFIKVIKDRFDKERRGFVLVSGPRTSGKTIFSRRMTDELKDAGFDAVYLDMDIEMDAYEKHIRRLHAIREEEIPAAKILRMRNIMKNLLAGREVGASKYEDGQIMDSSFRLKSSQVLVLEGDYALSDEVMEVLASEQTFGVFINTAPSMKLGENWPLTSLDLRFMRQILTFAGVLKVRRAIEVIREWPGIREHDLAHIYKTWKNADATFNTYLSYELPILKPYIEPLLEEALAEARRDDDILSVKSIGRLLLMLKDVPSVTMDGKIPANSILRQFIGRDGLVHGMARNAGIKISPIKNIPMKAMINAPGGTPTPPPSAPDPAVVEFYTMLKNHPHTQHLLLAAYVYHAYGAPSIQFVHSILLGQKYEGAAVADIDFSDPAKVAAALRLHNAEGFRACLHTIIDIAISVLPENDDHIARYKVASKLLLSRAAFMDKNASVVSAALVKIRERFSTATQVTVRRKSWTSIILRRTDNDGFTHIKLIVGIAAAVAAAFFMIWFGKSFASCTVLCAPLFYSGIRPVGEEDDDRVNPSPAIPYPDLPQGEPRRREPFKDVLSQKDGSAGKHDIAPEEDPGAKEEKIIMQLPRLPDGVVSALDVSIGDGIEARTMPKDDLKNDAKKILAPLALFTLLGLDASAATPWIAGDTLAQNLFAYSPFFILAFASLYCAAILIADNYRRIRRRTEEVNNLIKESKAVAPFESLKKLLEAYRIDPRNPVIMRLVADAYYRLGAREFSERWVKKEHKALMEDAALTISIVIGAAAIMTLMLLFPNKVAEFIDSIRAFLGFSPGLSHTGISFNLPEMPLMAAPLIVNISGKSASGDTPFGEALDLAEKALSAGELSRVMEICGSVLRAADTADNDIRERANDILARAESAPANEAIFELTTRAKAEIESDFLDDAFLDIKRAYAILQANALRRHVTDKKSMHIIIACSNLAKKCTLRLWRPDLAEKALGIAHDVSMQFPDADYVRSQQFYIILRYMRLIARSNDAYIARYVSRFEGVLEACPSDAISGHLLIFLAMKAGRFPEAIKGLDRLLAADDYDPSLRPISENMRKAAGILWEMSSATDGEKLISVYSRYLDEINDEVGGPNKILINRYRGSRLKELPFPDTPQLETEEPDNADASREEAPSPGELPQISVEDRARLSAVTAMRGKKGRSLSYYVPAEKQPPAQDMAGQREPQRKPRKSGLENLMDELRTALRSGNPVRAGQVYVRVKDAHRRAMERGEDIPDGYKELMDEAEISAIIPMMRPANVMHVKEAARALAKMAPDAAYGGHYVVTKKGLARFKRNEGTSFKFTSMMRLGAKLVYRNMELLPDDVRESLKESIEAARAHHINAPPQIGVARNSPFTSVKDATRNIVWLDRDWVEIFEKYVKDPEYKDAILWLISERLFHEIFHAPSERAQTIRDIHYYTILLRNHELKAKLDAFFDLPDVKASGIAEKTRARFKFIERQAHHVMRGDPVNRQALSRFIGKGYQGPIVVKRASYQPMANPVYPVRDLALEDELARGFIESLLKNTLQKKVVLAFSDSLGKENGRALKVLETVKELKRDKLLGHLLKNVETVICPAQNLDTKLQGYAGDPNTAVFTFVNNKEGGNVGALKGIENVRLFYIDDEKLNSTPTGREDIYFPLLEVVTISLLNYGDEGLVDNIPQAMKDAIGIESIDPRENGLVFVLTLPKSERHDINRTVADRYARLQQLLRFA